MPTDRLAEVVSRLNNAREEYRRAIENDRRVDRLIDDLGVPHPDGTQALRDANKVRSIAIEAYINALSEFTDCVMGEARSQRHDRGAW